MRLLSVTSVVYALSCVSLVGVPRLVGSQRMHCEQLEPYALVRGVDTAYAPAQAPATELRRHGFTVHCTVRSHSENLFDGQTVAAMFHTDRNAFRACPPAAARAPRSAEGHFDANSLRRTRALSARSRARTM